MLLGGKGGCQQCTCVPCDACTATCTQPHTGGAFGTVYTRYFAGVEAGNTTDGYLTATGDSDTSDPYDGMDGSGPWYQRVSGGFTLGGPTPGTRFPCSVRVSFWRNTYTLGASTIPPPGSTLTENTIEVIVTSGALVAPDGRVITAADGAVAVSSVPLVSGGGDASGSDPRSSGGTVSFSAQCWNVETIFTVRATIRWNVKKRQHVLYGLVRECYEIGTPCDSDCVGAGRPNVLYVEISNFSLNPLAFYYSSAIANVNGTYVLERVPNICTLWAGQETGDGCGKFTNAGQFVETGGNREFVADMMMYIRTGYTARGLALCMNPLVLSVPTGTMPAICGTGVIAYGSSTGTTTVNRVDSGVAVEVISCTFDWKVSA